MFARLAKHSQTKLLAVQGTTVYTEERRRVSDGVRSMQGNIEPCCTQFC
jgi:hypothetical protein